MSSNPLINEKKHKKDYMEEKNDEGGTNICDLPDPVLALIISSLPTKEAVRTSLLSKRWQHLWKDISKIDLKEGGYREIQLFREFVSKLLVIDKVSFEFGSNSKSSFIHSFAKSKEFEFEKDYIFSDSSSAHRLFSGCPSLEVLTLVYYNWMNVKAITISSPLLQKVVIRDCKYDDDEEDDYQSHEEDEEDDDGIGGQNGSKCCEIVVDAANLKSFSYGGFPGNDYSLISTNSLIEATIDIESPYNCFDFDHWESYQDAGYFVSSLLEKLSCVERLIITKATFMVLSTDESLLWDLSVFSNLVKFRLFSDSPNELSDQPTLEMLKNMPCLQVITFENGVCMPIDRANMDPIPMCFKTHLKTIKIRDCRGLEEELHGIKILLQSAAVLKKLHVRCRLYTLDRYSGTKEEVNTTEVYEKIAKFPRASVDCEI
ncbi:hypothetical protein PIB30_014180 [Stylosanthes scabra]|uniref:F-box domain-containing protein n=1 Tax=Stylosanthes scabra TaxID=79078 RepID=A0ABU6V7I0_9FABA|nr:hypothetical protein [Stylosanthes scabra]